MTPPRSPSRAGAALLPVLLLVVAAAAGGCAAPRVRAPEKLADAEPSAATVRVRAEEARLEGVRAGEPTGGMVDRAEVRISQRPGEEIPGGNGTRLAVQVPFRTPWEVGSERRAREEETAEAASRLDKATLLQRVEACFAGVELAAWRERGEQFEPYARRLEDLLAWNARLREQGVLTEVEALKVEVEARARLASREPRPPAWRGFAEGPLPDLANGAARLVVSPERVRETIRRHHPDPRAREAASRRYAALGARERAGALPWLDHFRVAYDLPGSRGDSGWGGQLGLRIPFGIEERAQAARYQGLATAEALEGEGQVAEHTREALAALAERAFLEERASRWRELTELADRSEAVAQRWYESRRGDASALLSLLNEAQVARQALIAARERAGELGCTVLATTGVSLEDWPRE